MPLQHLPVHRATRKHVDFMIVFGVWVPQLWRLPINGTDEAADHGARALFHLGQTKVGNLGNPFRGDEDVRGFAITMNDRGLSLMQILKTTSDIQHDG
jgi:hypothetical protein